MYILLSIMSAKVAIALALIIVATILVVVLKPAKEEDDEIPTYVPNEELKPSVSEQLEMNKKVYESNLENRTKKIEENQTTDKPTITLTNSLLEILMTKGKQAAIEFVTNSNENLGVKAVQAIVKSCIRDNNLRWDLPTKRYVKK